MKPTKSIILRIKMQWFHIDNYVAMFISQMIAIGFSKVLFNSIKTIAVFFVMLKVVAIVIGIEVLKKYRVFWGCLVLANEEKL